jgi:gamma-glutamyl:cysteine ligase YbdK (ATP-grasp superfamily)
MGADHDAYFEEVEARFENAHDLDLGLEEEFQVLDRDTLALTGAFEALRDSAPPRLRERIAGELLTSEIEVSTPRTLHFGQAAKQVLLNRAGLFAHAHAQGFSLCMTRPPPFSTR